MPRDVTHAQTAFLVTCAVQGVFSGQQNASLVPLQVTLSAVTVVKHVPSSVLSATLRQESASSAKLLSH